MPDLDQSIAQPYADQGVQVIGIHAGESPDQLADFVEQTGVTFELLADEGHTVSHFQYNDGVGYPYPRDVVIGPDLIIRSSENSFNADEMEALIQEILAE